MFEVVKWWMERWFVCQGGGCEDSWDVEVVDGKMVEVLKWWMGGWLEC